MLALCLMLLGTYYTLPIMLALCLMLLGTYYAQNYAGIIGRSLLGKLCFAQKFYLLCWHTYMCDIRNMYYIYAYVCCNLSC